MICSASGVFKSLDISPASVHDVNYLKDIRYQLADCTLLGSGGGTSTWMGVTPLPYEAASASTTKTTNALYLADRQGLSLALVVVEGQLGLFKEFQKEPFELFQ